eukprot:Seg1374.6 transcript_id=Seg1374.6/GoldUCD/mRNA.D3Y31 product="Selenoprotein F" protein_id=Seg1374.6/GoldUCD/D3Y31
MEASKGLLALVAFLASYLTVVIGKLSPQECRQLGFSSNLLCGSCNDLKQFKLDVLVDNCRSCCEKDKAENEGKFARGQDPILLLHDESNDVKDTLSIDKWDTDTIEEFLREKLVF